VGFGREAFVFLERFGRVEPFRVPRRTLDVVVGRFADGHVRVGRLGDFERDLVERDFEFAHLRIEDRDLFRTAMNKIGLATPRSAFVNTSELKQEFIQLEKAHFAQAGDPAALQKEWDSGESIRREKHRLHAQGQALEAYQKTDLPAIIRPSFTMGGLGGGIAYTLEELYEIVLTGVEASPTNEVLVEESVLGWKEFEMEVVRDRADNCIIVCSIENIDPMGVHTGDSITVAPALTLTDKEYQMMRNASIAVLREIGVETGGSNVQFAVNPEDGRLVVIEMNPRVSRSSALASKATGFPIAKVAARLAVGYTLDELKNEITGGEGFDFALECVGHPTTIRATYDAVRRGGTAVIVGVGRLDQKIEFSAFELFYAEKTLKGSMFGSANIHVDMPKLLRLWKAGKLDLEGMITRRMKLDEVNEAFRAMQAGEVVRSVLDIG